MIPHEVKQYIRGYYGRPPAEINPELKKLAIGDEEPIDSRPAGLLEPELPEAREALKDIPHEERDLISYALFPQYALEFLKRKARRKKRGEMTVEHELALIAAVLFNGMSRRVPIQSADGTVTGWSQAFPETEDGISAGGRWDSRASSWASTGRKRIMRDRVQGGV